MVIIGSFASCAVAFSQVWKSPFETRGSYEATVENRVLIGLFTLFVAHEVLSPTPAISYARAPV